MALNALVDSFLPHQKKHGNERVNSSPVRFWNVTGALWAIRFFSWDDFAPSYLGRHPKVHHAHTAEVVIFFTEDTWKVSGKYIYGKFHRWQSKQTESFSLQMLFLIVLTQISHISEIILFRFLFLCRIIIRGVVIDFALLLRGDHLPGKAQKSLGEINQSLFLTQPTNHNRSHTCHI